MDDNLKSQKKFAFNLYRGLLNDLGWQHQISSHELDRDYDTLVARTEAEGFGFLTKTLPKIAKSLDEALKVGQFATMSEFKHDTGVKYPSLFKGLFKLIFSRDGELRDHPDVAAIQSLRQLGYAFYKYQIPYKDVEVSIAVEAYVDVDQSITPLGCDVDTMATIYHAQEVLNEVFERFTLKDNLRPKNGPGAVAHGEQPWERYQPSKFYDKLDELVPYQSQFYFSDRHLFDRWDDYFELDHVSEGTAVLLAVPKDSRGPRLISKEPFEFMIYQQGLMSALVHHLEGHRLTGGQVNFTDQTINGELALKASKSQKLATLDLSAASDRLSLALVEALFEDLPELRTYICNARSSISETPIGYVSLRKYAPMGSALTFPVQSICFYALLVGELVRGGMSLRQASRSVWVYGDDIIIPNEFAPEAIQTLEKVGLKVNTDKSCYTGRFRESCGIDAYDGVDITPVKFKKLWQSRPEATTLQSWIEASNLLFRKGFWHASQAIKSAIELAVGNLPIVSSTSPLMGFETWSKAHAIEANRSRAKWSSKLQCNMYRGMKLTSHTKLQLKTGWERLLNYAWNSPQRERTSLLCDDQPFSTGLFTARHSVTKKHVVVAESAL